MNQTPSYVIFVFDSGNAGADDGVVGLDYLMTCQA
jgi:hypothetical protein